MKVYKITYSEKYSVLARNVISVQYTRDEELVKVLKQNEYDLEEDVEIEELELKEKE